MNTQRTRFETKVIRRRTVAALHSVGYFTLLALAAFFVGIQLIFMIALKLSGDTLLVVSGVFAFFIVIAYMAGWNSQRNFKGTIDTWLADADPVEKLVVAQEVAEERKEWEAEARVLDVTAEQGAPQA